MAKYDGLIIPRSYNDYINKSDPQGVAQALQLTGVMDAAPTENSEKPAKSGGIYAALAGKQPALTFDDVPTDDSNNPVKSGGIFAANAVIMASGATLSGVAISAGSVVRVLFTAALTGSNATTGLTLTYNGNTYAVKVGKNGALANFLANNIDGSYIYCQAYTTLELMFDGSQFIIMGNPVVISSADYTIYTNGSKVYVPISSISFGLQNPVTSDIVYNKLLSKSEISYSNLNSKVSMVRFNKNVRLGKYIFSTWSFDLSSTLNENEVFCNLNAIAEETMFFTVCSPYSNKFTSFRIEKDSSEILNGGVLDAGIVYSCGVCFIAKD